MALRRPSCRRKRGAVAHGLVGPGAAQVHRPPQARRLHRRSEGVSALLHIGQHVGGGAVGRNHQERGVGHAQDLGEESHVVQVAGGSGGPHLPQGVEARAGAGHGRDAVALGEQGVNELAPNGPVAPVTTKCCCAIRSGSGSGGAKLCPYLLFRKCLLKAVFLLPLLPKSRYPPQPRSGGIGLGTIPPLRGSPTRTPGAAAPGRENAASTRRA